MEQRCIHSFPRLMTYPLMGTAVSRDTEQQTFASLGSDDRNGSRLCQKSVRNEAVGKLFNFP